MVRSVEELEEDVISRSSNQCHQNKQALSLLYLQSQNQLQQKQMLWQLHQKQSREYQRQQLQQQEER
jgi:hypothetical protein